MGRRHGSCEEAGGTTQAGVGGRQTLPESFKVVRTGYRDTPQSIYLNRDLLVEAWQLQKVGPLRHVPLKTPLASICFLVSPYPQSPAWSHQLC